MRKIKARLGDKQMWLSIKSGDDVPALFKAKRRMPEKAIIEEPQLMRNVWPWPMMLAGEYVQIPLGRVDYFKLNKSLYFTNKTSQDKRFIMRTTPKHFCIWCVNKNL